MIHTTGAVGFFVGRLFFVYMLIYFYGMKAGVTDDLY
jgi:hypothetical protein